MAGELSLTNDELERMIANFEWNSDEDSDTEEPSDTLPLSINAKFLWPDKLEDDPYFDKKPPDDGDSGSSTVHAILASVTDEGASIDVPDGWKVPKRISFVEVGALKDQRASLAASLVSSTVSSQHLQQDVDEDEVNIGGDASTPGERSSGSVAPLDNIVYDEGKITPQPTAKQYHIAMELLTTERTYVRGLHIVEKVLHGALKTTLKSNRTILSEKSMKDVVLNIAEIYAMSYGLLRELEQRMECWDKIPTVADLVIKRGPYFKLYSMYSSNFETAQIEYSRLLRKNKAFRELVQTIETSPVCMGMPLSSYMLLPIQRIPRYRLLLLDYLEHLPRGAPDFQNAELALKTVSFAADQMNNRIKQLENQARIIRIQKSFAGKESIVEPGRYYVGRGPVLMVTGQGRLKFRQCVIYLFSDLLLVTMVTATGSYKIKQKLMVVDMKVSNLNSDICENGFVIAVPSLNKAFRFQAQSTEERDLWTRRLRQVIAEECSHRRTYDFDVEFPKFYSDPHIKTAVEVLSEDPSIEARESNWMRRSFRRSVRRLRKVPNSPELQKEDDIDDPSSEMTTEFVTADQEDGYPIGTMLIPCLDNRLSAYLNQKSIYRDVWRRRWFILTNWLLVCFEDHTREEPTGALPLSGYHVSLPDVADGISRSLVFKLTHPTKRPYFFQLVTEYELNRWFKTLQELCASDALKLSTLV